VVGRVEAAPAIGVVAPAEAGAAAAAIAKNLLWRHFLLPRRDRCSG